MVCHVVRFTEKTATESAPRWGVLLAEKIFPLAGTYHSTADLLGEGKAEALALAENPSGKSAIDLQAVELLSPVTKPCQVICQGANYEQHMVDSGMDPKDKTFNMFFHKSAGSIHDPQKEVVRPGHVRLLDYEVELGLVIGKAIHEEVRITDQTIGEYVAGIVIGNDVSARDVQIPQMQFFKGKSYRTFCPVGPVLCLLEKDEMHYLHSMELTLKVNGELRQQDSSSNLVHKPAETLTELSQFSDVEVGDLILTGTPSGCAMRIPPAAVTKLAGLLPEQAKWRLFRKMQGRRSEYLKPGDLMETSIKSSDRAIDLGTQRNRIA